mmetsp:Transcript_20172/g.47018  ORF Transcript_20172/g.47018 Transcript_20172/m.47018 type:complete len:206 (+) Transcript_20172:48-665(+)
MGNELSCSSVCSARSGKGEASEGDGQASSHLTDDEKALFPSNHGSASGGEFNSLASSKHSSEGDFGAGEMHHNLVWPELEPSCPTILEGSVEDEEEPGFQPSSAQEKEKRATMVEDQLSRPAPDQKNGAQDAEARPSAFEPQSVPLAGRGGSTTHGQESMFVNAPTVGKSREPESQPDTNNNSEKRKSSCSCCPSIRCCRGRKKS